jgi:cytochrome c oxidase subunit 1
VSIPRIRSESPAFDLHHPEVALMELDQNQRAATGADEAHVDAPEQHGRREHLEEQQERED